jgi:hypothetical protein
MRKYTVSLFLVTLLVLSWALTPAASASQNTLKNLYFSLTYPSVVKMPKGNCGSFKVSYILGIKAKQAGFGSVVSGVLVDSDLAAGIYWSLDLGVGKKLKNRGTATWKFCKRDWLDSEDEAYIGISPGTYNIGFVSDFNRDEQEKWGKIRFIN